MYKEIPYLYTKSKQSTSTRKQRTNTRMATIRSWNGEGYSEVGEVCGSGVVGVVGGEPNLYLRVGCPSVLVVLGGSVVACPTEMEGGEGYVIHQLTPLCVCVRVCVCISHFAHTHVYI